MKGSFCTSNKIWQEQQNNARKVFRNFEVFDPEVFDTLKNHDVQIRKDLNDEKPSRTPVSDTAFVGHQPMEIKRATKNLLAFKNSRTSTSRRSVGWQLKKKVDKKFVQNNNTNCSVIQFFSQLPPNESTAS